jgi:molybdopterin-guanine dinucleotide biosynthesis protein A
MAAGSLQTGQPAREPKRRAGAGILPASGLHFGRNSGRQDAGVPSGTGPGRSARKVSRSIFPLAASILAGGRSSRMGRDKSGLRVGRRTMLAHARQAARTLGLPVRVIRRDLVPRCGPLGGVLTALKTSRAQGELFLACDMPFVSVALLRKLLRVLSGSRRAAFTLIDRLAGFPFVLRVECAPIVEAHIAAKEFSLQALARALRAPLVSPPGRECKATFNINTRADLAAARAVNSRRDTRPRAGRPRRPRSRRGQSSARS